MSFKQFVARLLLIVFIPFVIFPLGILVAFLAIPGTIILGIIRWVLYCTNVNVKWDVMDVLYVNMFERVISLLDWYLDICDGY